MHVLVTCKYKNDPMKNNREKVATPFSSYNITRISNIRQKSPITFIRANIHLRSRSFSWQIIEIYRKMYSNTKVSQPYTHFIFINIKTGINGFYKDESSFSHY